MGHLSLVANGPVEPPTVGISIHLDTVERSYTRQVWSIELLVRYTYTSCIQTVDPPSGDLPSFL